MTPISHRLSINSCHMLQKMCKVSIGKHFISWLSVKNREQQKYFKWKTCGQQIYRMSVLKNCCIKLWQFVELSIGKCYTIVRQCKILKLCKSEYRNLQFRNKVGILKRRFRFLKLATFSNINHYLSLPWWRKPFHRDSDEQLWLFRNFLTRCPWSRRTPLRIWKCRCRTREDVWREERQPRCLPSRRRRRRCRETSSCCTSGSWKRRLKLLLINSEVV